MITNFSNIPAIDYYFDSAHGTVGMIQEGLEPLTATRIRNWWEFGTGPQKNDLATVSVISSFIDLLSFTAS